MIAAEISSCGKGERKQYVAGAPGAGASEAGSTVGPEDASRTPAIDSGFGGDDEPEGGAMELDDPEPADPAEDVLNAVIRQFTHPITGETCEIVDWRVSIAFVNPPVIPLMDENYFDTPRIQVDPYYSIQYPLLVWDPAIDAFIASENLQVMSEWRAHKILGVSLPPETTVEEAILIWPAVYAGLVVSVEPDFVYYSDAWPNDDPNEERLAYCWRLLDWIYSDDYDIGVKTAWQGGYTGNSDVVVAVLDTGVQRSHPDLVSRLTEWGVNTFPKKYKVYIDRWGGEPWKSLIDASEANAKHLGHGTCVAGIVAASVNNDPDAFYSDTDALGIAAYCKMLPLVASAKANQAGTGAVFESFSIYNAYYAPGAFKRELDPWQLWPDNQFPHYNIEVVNCSFGKTASDPHEIRIVQSIAPYTLFVGSAGNDNSPTAVHWPARVDLGLAVAAYEKDGTRWVEIGPPPIGSNWNPAFVDIAAPGFEIATTDMHGTNKYGKQLGYDPAGYHYWFLGTSVAAPHVSGVAALIALHTSDNTSQIRSRIIINHQDLPVGELSYGGIDAARVFGLPH